MRDTYELELGKQGRIVIPADVRQELGIEPGMTLVLTVEDGLVLLGSREAYGRAAQAMFAGSDRSLSEELMAERRAEAAAEAAADEVSRRARGA